MYWKFVKFIEICHGESTQWKGVKQDLCPNMLISTHLTHLTSERLWAVFFFNNTPDLNPRTNVELFLFNYPGGGRGGGGILEITISFAVLPASTTAPPPINTNWCSF